MRRGARPEAYDLHFPQPSPLIRRRDIFEVGERIDRKGVMLAPLDESELDSVLATVLPAVSARRGVLSPNSYRNPGMRSARDYLRGGPGLFVTPSRRFVGNGGI